jgi:hypothetical protein
MISGTPLYSSIDDLNGELNFLAVQPFCLRDDQDGFWDRRIKSPWENRDPNSRELLLVLLRGIMIRHSKKQHTLDGRPLLVLPKATHRFVGINFCDDGGRSSRSTNGSSSSTSSSGLGNIGGDVWRQNDSRGRANLYVVGSIENLLCQTIKELKSLSSYRASYQSGRDVRSVANNGRVVQLLRILKMSTISLNLINGGGGCKPGVLRELNMLFHRSNANSTISIFNNFGSGSNDGEVLRVDDIPLLTGEQALVELMRSRERMQSSNAIASGMTNQSANTQTNYASGRTYVIEDPITKFSNAIGQLKSHLVDGQIPLRRILARTRWQLAFEAITQGYYQALITQNTHGLNEDDGSETESNSGETNETKQDTGKDTIIAKKKREYTRIFQSTRRMEKNVLECKKLFHSMKSQQEYLEFLKNEIENTIAILHSCKERAITALNKACQITFKTKLAEYYADDFANIEPTAMKKKKLKKRPIKPNTIEKDLSNKQLYYQLKSKRFDIVNTFNRQSCPAMTWLSRRSGKNAGYANSNLFFEALKQRVIMNSIVNLDDDDYDAYLKFKQEYEYMEELTKLMSKVSNNSTTDSSNSCKDHLKRHLKSLEKLAKKRAKYVLDGSSPCGWRHQKDELLWYGKNEIIVLEELEASHQIAYLDAEAKKLRVAVEEGNYSKAVELKAKFKEDILNYLTFQKKESRRRGEHNKNRQIGEQQFRQSELVKRKYIYHDGKTEGDSVSKRATGVVQKQHVATRAKIETELKICRRSLLEVNGRLEKLLPYINRLLSAIENEHKLNQAKNDSDRSSSSSSSSSSSNNNIVEHSGFRALQSIMDWDGTPASLPSCSICLAPVENPAFTRCCHLACGECIITWLAAAPLIDTDARRQQARQQAALLNYSGDNEDDRARLIARERCAPCMLCRQPFSISQLIRVDPEEAKKSKEQKKDDNEEENINKEVHRGADGEKENNFNPFDPVADFERPRFVQCFNQDILDDIPSPDTRNMRGHSFRDPTLPGLKPLFLTQMNIATGVPANARSSLTSKTHRSPKIRELLRLLKPIMKTNNGTGKAVVFSQLRAAISHTAFVLKEEKIGFVKITRGDAINEQR